MIRLLVHIAARRRAALSAALVLAFAVPAARGFDQQAVAEHFARRLLGTTKLDIRHHKTYEDASGNPHACVFIARAKHDRDAPLTLAVAPDRKSFPLLFYYFAPPFDSSPPCTEMVPGPTSVVITAAGVLLRSASGTRKWPEGEIVEAEALEALLAEGGLQPAASPEQRGSVSGDRRDRLEAAWASVDDALSAHRATAGEPVEYIIPGVPSYLWYMNCALITETMILGYWDDHGHDSLVPGGTSLTGCPWAITEELCWIEWAPSRVGYYASARELGNDVPFLVASAPTTGWEDYRSLIDARKSPLAVSWGGPPYGAHATVGVGYKESDGQRFLILHDTWVSPPAYINYDQYAASLMGIRCDYPADASPGDPAPASPRTQGWSGFSIEPTTFTFSPALSPSSYSYHCLEPADLDGDGRLDFVVCNFSLAGSRALAVYMDRDGQLVQDVNFRPSLPQYECPHAARAADFDGDGDLDVAVTGYWCFVRVFVNQGTSLSSASIVVDSTGRGFTDVAWGDIDGDGDGDLAAGTVAGPLRVYRSAAGSFEKILEFGGARQYMQVAFCDLDGDRYPELISCDRNGSVVAFRNEGGFFSGSRLVAPSSGHGAMTFDVGDVDKDGFPEIVTVDDGRLAFFENEGGVMASAPAYIAGAFESFAKDLTISDLDGDEYPEILVASYSGPNAIIPNASGRFPDEPCWVSSTAEPSARVHAFDRDGDGTKEIAFMKFRGGQLEFLRAIPVQPTPFLRGDANGDGTLDISDPVAILLYLFGGWDGLHCEASADANDSETVEISDVVAMLAYLFTVGAVPPSPFEDCGIDPTPGGLSCLEYPPCAGGE